MHGAGKRAEQHKANDDGGQQDTDAGGGQNAADLLHALGDELLDEAHTDNAPMAVFQRGERIDHAAALVAAVRQARDERCVLPLEVGIDELLLRVIDDVAALVHQEAVAVLADADVVQVGRNAAEADVQRDPFLAARRIERRNERDDPRIIALKDRGHMRRGDIAVGIVVHFIGIKRKILINLRALCPARPAVHKPARRVIGRDGHNVRPDLQEGGKEVVPVLPRILELSLEQLHEAVDIVQIVLDRLAYLGDGLARRGLHAPDERALICLQEHGHGSQHDGRDGTDERQHQNGCHAQAASFPRHAPSPPRSLSARRSCAGETP